MLSLLMHMPLLLAGEIARALLYARPPEWADKEAISIEQRASSQQFSALAAVCEAAPQEVVPSAWMYVLLGSRGFLHMHGQLDKHSCIGRAHSRMPQHAGVHAQTAGLLACAEGLNSAAACKVPCAL